MVKLDIEGGEVDALEGMSDLVARSGERLTLFLECNPDALAAAGRSADDLVAWLSDHGFRLFEIRERERRLAPLGALPPPGAYVNLMCVPAGRSVPDFEAGAEAK